jgi:hypothetical protein
MTRPGRAFNPDRISALFDPGVTRNGSAWLVVRRDSLGQQKIQRQRMARMSILSPVLGIFIISTARHTARGEIRESETEQGVARDSPAGRSLSA